MRQHGPPQRRELVDTVGIAKFRKTAHGVGDLGVPLAAFGIGVNAVT
jgi:hypothetical protein